MWITLSKSLLWLADKPPRLVLRKAVVRRGEKTNGFWRILWQNPWTFTWVSPHDVRYGEQDTDLEEEEICLEEEQPENEKNEKSYSRRLVIRKPYAKLTHYPSTRTSTPVR